MGATCSETRFLVLRTLEVDLELQDKDISTSATYCLMTQEGKKTIAQTD